MSAYTDHITTCDLLEAVSERMEKTQNSTRGRELGSLCREANRSLSAGVLNHRPYDTVREIPVTDPDPVPFGIVIDRFAVSMNGEVTLIEYVVVG